MCVVGVAVVALTVGVFAGLWLADLMLTRALSRIGVDAKRFIHLLEGKPVHVKVSATDKDEFIRLMERDENRGAIRDLFPEAQGGP